MATSDGQFQALIDHAADLLAQGKTKDAVVADLQARGIAPPAATVIADIAADPKVRRAGANYDVVVGGFLVLVGIGASAWTYTQSRPGGSYVIMAGLIVVGGRFLLRGLARL